MRSAPALHRTDVAVGGGAPTFARPAAAASSPRERVLFLPDPPDRRVGNASRAELHRRQLETVAENATLALFVMDERQQCTYMNP
jgi:hypothetical protein